MIRVAVVIGKMNSGGKKTLVMEYYKHIDKDKVQFDFICDSDSEAIPNEEIESLGGKVYIIAPYQNILLNMFDIYNLCKNNHYLIMHAYNSTMNIFPMLAAKLAGVPIRINESISMAHEGDWKTIIKKLLRPMSRMFSTDYLSCGEECGIWQFGKKAFDDGKIEVFKTAINTEYQSFNSILREETREKYNWDKNIIIGHIGRFTYQKNTLFLLDIVAQLMNLDSRVRLCLIGDGELREKVLEKISELGIKDKVDYFGRREDIEQFYNAMDCFLLPSLYEGLPVVGLDAQCCGLPVFFSTEITQEAKACELGYFIDLNKKPEVWADTILRVTKNNMKRRRSYAIEVADGGFDSKKEAKRLQQYYFERLADEGVLR